MCTPRPDTTPRHSRVGLRTFIFAAALLSLSVVSSLRAQSPSQPAAPQVPLQGPDYAIKKDVNLVVLHVSVINDRGQFVPGSRKAISASRKIRSTRKSRFSARKMCP